MIFVAATFIGVLLLVLGIYWMMVERPESLELGKLRKRLTMAACELTTALGVPVEPEV